MSACWFRGKKKKKKPFCQRETKKNLGWSYIYLAVSRVAAYLHFFQNFHRGLINWKSKNAKCAKLEY